VAGTENRRSDEGERALTKVKRTKQYLPHNGFLGHLSIVGNLVFMFTPLELVAGPTYRFSTKHVMEMKDLVRLLPVEVEDR
jgi:hypothetical protein